MRYVDAKSEEQAGNRGAESGEVAAAVRLAALPSAGGLVARFVTVAAKNQSSEVAATDAVGVEYGMPVKRAEKRRKYRLVVWVVWDVGRWVRRCSITT